MVSSRKQVIGYPTTRHNHIVSDTIESRQETGDKFLGKDVTLFVVFSKWKNNHPTIHLLRLNVLWTYWLSRASSRRWRSSSQTRSLDVPPPPVDSTTVGPIRRSMITDKEIRLCSCYSVGVLLGSIPSIGLLSEEVIISMTLSAALTL